MVYFPHTHTPGHRTDFHAQHIKQCDSELGCAFLGFKKKFSIYNFKPSYSPKPPFLARLWLERKLSLYNGSICLKFYIQIKDRPFIPTDHSLNWIKWMVVDLYLHDTGKTANINHRNINNNKTAILLNVYLTTNTAKIKGDITVHQIDIMTMCSKVISPAFYFCSFRCTHSRPYTLL